MPNVSLSIPIRDTTKPRKESVDTVRFANHQSHGPPVSKARVEHAQRVPVREGKEERIVGTLPSLTSDMKFGKLLRNTAEAQPEWADAYLDYKLLKKKLKALKRNEEDAGAGKRKKKKKDANETLGHRAGG